MEKAAKEITSAEEIMAITEEIVAEAKEEATEAPSRLHEIWKRAGTFFSRPQLTASGPRTLAKPLPASAASPVIKSGRCDELPSGKPVEANNN